MIFWILTPHKIEAYEKNLSDFYADDLFLAIQSVDAKIATTQECLTYLEQAYPKYHKYKVQVTR